MHRIEVDPFPFTPGSLEADVMAELKHHIFSAIYRLELPRKPRHVDDAPVLAGPGDQGYNLGVIDFWKLTLERKKGRREVKSRTLPGTPQQLLVLPQCNIGRFCGIVSLVD